MPSRGFAFLPFRRAFPTFNPVGELAFWGCDISHDFFDEGSHLRQLGGIFAIEQMSGTCEKGTVLESERFFDPVEILEADARQQGPANVLADHGETGGDVVDGEVVP